MIYKNIGKIIVDRLLTDYLINDYIISSRNYFYQADNMSFFQKRKKKKHYYIIIPLIFALKVKYFFHF